MKGRFKAYNKVLDVCSKLLTYRLGNKNVISTGIDTDPLIIKCLPCIIAGVWVGLEQLFNEDLGLI
jgi:hypothetical protein